MAFPTTTLSALFCTSAITVLTFLSAFSSNSSFSSYLDAQVGCFCDHFIALYLFIVFMSLYFHYFCFLFINLEAIPPSYSAKAFKEFLQGLYILCYQSGIIC